MAEKSKEDVMEILHSLDAPNKLPKSNSSRKYQPKNRIRTSEDGSETGNAPRRLGSSSSLKKNVGKDKKELLGFFDSLSTTNKTGKNDIVDIKKSDSNKPSRSNTPTIKNDEFSSNNNNINTNTKDNLDLNSISNIENDLSTNEESVVSSISSWWNTTSSSSLWDSARKVVKNAEAVVQEKVQNRDEIMAKLEEQVRGNVNQIKALNINGQNFNISQSLASTLSTVIQTLAPPIEAHEQLRINIIHDMVGYPKIDDIVYHVFDRVMEQVEGGDLIIAQKGTESHKNDSSNSNVKQLNLFTGGVLAGEKLVKANIKETVGKLKLKNIKQNKNNQDFEKSNETNKEKDDKNIEKDQQENDDKQTTINEKNQEKIQNHDENNDFPVEVSNIYICIQPSLLDNLNKNNFTFIVGLYDPENDIEFINYSQPLPLQWATWMDSNEPVPGPVDPREWIEEWIEESIALVLGILAQSYVSQRMAIGVEVDQD